MLPSTRRVCLVAFIFTSLSRAFYLPGSAPRDYLPGDAVDVLVNALSPVIGPEAKLVRVIIYGVHFYKLWLTVLIRNR